MYVQEIYKMITSIVIVHMKFKEKNHTPFNIRKWLRQSKKQDTPLIFLI